MSSIKLGRKSAPRDRLLRNLATSLVLYEVIVTTEAKAKAVKPLVERIIRYGRSNTLAGRREALALLFDPNAVRKLFEDFPARYGTRQSGFVRITKMGTRPGDGAPKARLEILLTPLETVIAEETKAPAKAKKTAEAPV